MATPGAPDLRRARRNDGRHAPPPRAQQPNHPAPRRGEPKSDRRDEIDTGEGDDRALQARDIAANSPRRGLAPEHDRPVEQALGHPHPGQRAHEPYQHGPPSRRDFQSSSLAGLAECAGEESTSSIRAVPRLSHGYFMRRRRETRSPSRPKRGEISVDLPRRLGFVLGHGAASAAARPCRRSWRARLRRNHGPRQIRDTMRNSTRIASSKSMARPIAICRKAMRLAGRRFRQHGRPRLRRQRSRRSAPRQGRREFAPASS